ncbi:hypothetical protein R6Q57_026773 [Mikania cordata]
MDGQRKSQRVVLIHDASGGVRFKALRWVLDGFLLKDGDMFTFLSVLHQIHHPLGYKIRIDGSMFGGANQKVIDDEVARKKKEYDDNLQLLEISKKYQTHKVDFKIELVAGPIPKTAALDASKKCNPTWVILDRKMKRDQKYFLEKLSCGISRMKRNDDIIDIRGPRRKHQTSVPYDEMLPADKKISRKESYIDQDLFSIDFETSCTSSTSTGTSNSDNLFTIGNKIELSTLLEDEQENSPGIKEKLIEEVNGYVEIIGQSQHIFDEEVNHQISGISPVPKQAKHFYQGAQI